LKLLLQPALCCNSQVDWETGMETKWPSGVDCFAFIKCSSNPPLAVATEGFFDSEGYCRLTPGFVVADSHHGVFGMERMDADLPKTRERQLAYRTKCTAAGPQARSGATASATGLLHTYQPRRLMRLSFFLV
jgi:hypothetical protein